MVLTIACLCLLFSCVAGKNANEQDVLNAFTDVYDIMYGIRDAQAKLIQELRDNQTKLIQELRDNDLEKTEEIKFLKLQIEELQKITAPATCSELRKQNITRDQEIYLDSDGLNHGEKPVKALCDFANNITKVGADQVINIEQCGSPKCFREEIQYGTPRESLVALVEKSNNCYQQVTFDCLSSPLQVKYLEKFSV